MERGVQDLLTPKVKVIYNLKSKGYLNPFELDLTKTIDEKIVSWVAPEPLGIDITNFF